MPPGDPAALESWAGQLVSCADAFERWSDRNPEGDHWRGRARGVDRPAADGYRQFCGSMVDSAGRDPGVAAGDLLGGPRVCGHAGRGAAASQVGGSHANATPAASRQAALDSALQVGAPRAARRAERAGRRGAGGCGEVGTGRVVGPYRSGPQAGGVRLGPV